MEASVESSIKNYCSDEVVGRLDVISGPTGRRRWTDEIKGRIVAESFATKDSVSSVARRHGIVPSQLFMWRRQARDGKLVLPMEDGALFAPVVVENARQTEQPETSALEVAVKTIAVEIDGVVIRLSEDTPPRRIAAIVRALRSGS